MSSRKAGSSSTHKQYAVRELRSKASTTDDFKFNSQLRARDSITAKKQVLFLPASQCECELLRQAWPSHSNAFDSAYALKLYSDPAPIGLPNAPSSDYKSKVPDTFYPDLLIQFVDDFSKGSVCREEGYTLYHALTIVQDAVADVMDGSKAKTKEAVVAMFKNPKVTSALAIAYASQSYYRIFWHKTRGCPLFALRFICLLCDFCEKVLTKAEYTSKVYNEDSRRGLGALKGPSHTVASLAIPLPLDPSKTYEGRVLWHPVTDLILLPDPSGVEDLPPASPLLNAVEDDDFSMEGPASPGDENDGPASPTAGFDDEDDGETEVSEDTEAKDVFKAPKGKGKAKASNEFPIRSSPRIRHSKASTAKVGPPVASRPVPKLTKRERDTSSPVADVEMQAPLPKKAKTSTASAKATKETPPPQVADTAAIRTSKGSKSSVATQDVAMEPE
ncbi:hypothetical protein EV360DRAFT_77132, partial [Lentinula raphanica]